MAIFGDIILNFISAAIFVGINGLVLWWLSGLFKLKNRRPKIAFTVALYAGIVSFILALFPSIIPVLAAIIPTLIFFVINAAVLIYLIMRFYKIMIGKAIIMWLGIFIVNVIIGFLIGLIIGISGLVF